MSSNAIIQVQNLSKCYKIFTRPQDRLKQAIFSPLQQALKRSSPPYYREFWALKNVSFDIYEGETVGILGQNGSGKSTLLQILSGILKPTQGQVLSQGRTAALLELGAGFNPEFTGQENIFLNAMVLGLTEQQINACYEAIVSFADIGDFISQPVKIYSSGMFARLAFAIAIHVEPKILIIDEALAVGDESFQRKCFARMEKIRQNGATILFVSHSSSTINNLCNRAILLHKGECLFTGEPKRAIFFNQKIGNSRPDNIEELLKEIRLVDKQHENYPIEESPLAFSDKKLSSAFNYVEFFDQSLTTKSYNAYEPLGAEIKNPVLVTEQGLPVNQIFRNQQYHLECHVVFSNDCYNIRFYAVIRTVTGIDLAGCAYPSLSETGINCTAGESLKLRFSFSCQLNPATYFCNFAVQGEDGSLHHRLVDAFAFRVMAKDENHATGIVDLHFSPSLTRVEQLLQQETMG